MKKLIDGKKVVFLDVDGVLVNFNEYFNIHLKNSWGLQIKKDHVPKSWDYADVLKDTGIEFKEVFTSLPHDWVAKLSQISGAHEFTKRLHELGVYIVMITHVPDNQVNNRIKNLIKHRIFFDEIYCIDKEPKNKLASILTHRYVSKDGTRPEFFAVDDYARNVFDFLRVKQISKVFTLDIEINSTFVGQLKKMKKRVHLSKTNKDLYSSIIDFVSPKEL